MDETARLVIVGLVLVLAFGTAFVSRKRRSVVRVLPPELGPFPSVVLFGSDTCVSCAPVIEALRSHGIAFDGYSWEADRPLFDSLHIDEVPRVFATDATGRVVVDIRGEVTAGDLARLRRIS